MMPLIVANFILGMRIWSSKPRGKVLNIVYSAICLVLYCVLMKVSVVYLNSYYVYKATSLGDITFEAMFYVNIVLTLFLVPAGWWKGKVTSRGPIYSIVGLYRNIAATFYCKIATIVYNCCKILLHDCSKQ